MLPQILSPALKLGRSWEKTRQAWQKLGQNKTGPGFGCKLTQAKIVHISNRFRTGADHGQYGMIDYITLFSGPIYVNCCISNAVASMCLVQHGKHHVAVGNAKLNDASCIISHAYQPCLRHMSLPCRMQLLLRRPPYQHYRLVIMASTWPRSRKSINFLVLSYRHTMTALFAHRVSTLQRFVLSQLIVSCLHLQRHPMQQRSMPTRKVRQAYAACLQNALK